MIQITIPGYKTLHLSHLVMDYNGTLACDGKLIDGVADLLHRLSKELSIHVLTADTFGLAKAQLEGLPLSLCILPEEKQDKGKLNHIQQLGADTVVAIGNGRNDKLMLEHAALGIALLQEEGACAETLTAAHMVCRNIIDALHLLTTPKRLIAGLRR